MDIQEMCGPKVTSLGTSYENIVNRNVNELYQVTNKPHDGEADRDCLANLDKFCVEAVCK